MDSSQRPHATRDFLLLSALTWIAAAGCGMLRVIDVENEYPAGAEFANAAPIENPIVIPVSDREFAWNAIVDSVDDYFDIASERRVQLVGNVLTEGEIVTHIKPGASLPERWHRDSTPGFERLQSTFQTIRRRANIRVTPDSAGYLVHVMVYKELEDIDRPEQAAVGHELKRHDGGLVGRLNSTMPGSVHLGWIPIGRDISLEQTILADLRARFYDQVAPIDIERLPATPSGFLHHQ